MRFRLAGALVGVVAILGLRLYGRTSAHDDVKARLVALCASDAECLADVQKHYDACFESAYGTGDRRSRVDVDALVRCVNSRSGVPYFAVLQEDKP